MLAAIATLARLRAVSRSFGRRTSIGASRPSLPLIIGLIAVHACFALVLIIRAGLAFGSDGIDRYIEIATSEGRPYVDRQVEYMPVDVLVMEMVVVDSPEGSYRGFVMVALAADLGIAAVLAYAWGSATAVRYLVLSLAALPFLFLTTDLVSVFLAVAGIALALRGRETLGGVTLAAAILAKVWPAAVVPALLVAGRRRAVAVACVGAASGIGAWLLYAGAGGPSQVLTFRGAKGWEVESIVGVVVWIALGRTTTVEQGAPRVGTPTEHHNPYRLRIFNDEHVVFVNARDPFEVFAKGATAVQRAPSAVSLCGARPDRGRAGSKAFRPPLRSASSSRVRHSSV